MANVEKLEAVLDHIRDHREQHNQAEWGTKGSCGTTFCFAGTTVVLAGYQLEWIDAKDLPTQTLLSDIPGARAVATHCFLPKDHPCAPSQPNVRGGYVQEIERVAAYELGLTPDERHMLFRQAVTFEDVERVVKEIVNNNKHWGP